MSDNRILEFESDFGGTLHPYHAFSRSLPNWLKSPINSAMARFSITSSSYGRKRQVTQVNLLTSREPARGLANRTRSER
jgi:hypothetical protein